MHLFRYPSDISPIGPDILFSINGYPVANSTLMIGIIVALVVLAAVFVYMKTSMRPGRMMHYIEMVYESLFGLVEQITGNRRRTKQIFPLIGTLFVFIGLSNLLGLFPGISSLTLDGKSVFRTATSDFNTTFALATAMILLLQIVSIKEWGLFSHIGKYFQVKGIYQGFRKSIGDGFIAIVNFFIGLLDIVSELAKIISLSLRLFGNMYAGEVLMTVIISAFAYFVPAVWLSMSLLSAVVQTMVFSLLVTAFYMLSINPEADKKEDHHRN